MTWSCNDVKPDCLIGQKVNTYCSKEPLGRLSLDQVQPLHSEPTENELNPVFTFWDGTVANEGRELVCDPNFLGFFYNVTILLL